MKNPLTLVAAAVLSATLFLVSCGSGNKNEGPSPIAVTGVTLNKDSLTLLIGNFETLIETVSPSDATNKAVKWSSDDPAKATVTNGLVTAVGAGIANITVTTLDGSKTATCQVTVSNRLEITLVSTTISSGGGHTLAIKADGSLWSWGHSLFGQLGLGNTTSRDIPVQVGSDKDWKIVSAGEDHSMAIKSDGSLWGWGDNRFGTLGIGTDGTTASRYVPTRVGSGTDWKAVSAGHGHTMAIKNDGSLWACGSNGNRQLGLGDTTLRNVFVQVGSSRDWKTVSAGDGYTLAIKNDGTLWAWGTEYLGNGNFTSSSTPIQLGTANDWAVVSAASHHNMAIKLDGSRWAWGSGSLGALGDGSQTSKDAPTQMDTRKDWVAVSIGFNHSVLLRNDGTLWACGYNAVGQVGDGTNNAKFSLVRIGVSEDFVSVSAGDDHNMALMADGSLWAWGSNSAGKLGLGLSGYIDCTAPVQVGTGFLVPGR